MNGPIRSSLLYPRWANLGGDMDHVLDGFFRSRATTSGTGPDPTVAPLVDVIETDGAYQVVVDLPGVAKANIEVTVHDGVLTISAESKSAGPAKGAENHEEKTAGRVLRRERRFGKFQRSLNLGPGVDEGQVSARSLDGVLTVEIPKTAAALPRKVAVNVH